jgi:hypothetical protein
VSSEDLTDLFGKITEPLYRKHDTASCGGNTCEIPLRLAVSKYIQIISTNILTGATCLMLQSAHAMSNITKVADKIKYMIVINGKKLK